jgi:hypothetical protein
MGRATLPSQGGGGPVYKGVSAGKEGPINEKLQEANLLKLFHYCTTM